MITKLLKIKICGLFNKKNISEIENSNPDYMGFIFYKYSKRYIGDNFTIPSIRKNIKKVGVFVNEKENIIEKKKIKYSLDYVQLHGNENLDYCYNIKNKGMKIIKSFGINKIFNFEKMVKPYNDICDIYLFDNKTNIYGGSGKKFSWKKIYEYNFKLPFFISGGISLYDIKNILSISHPYFFGIDINSKFETKNCIKDIFLVNKFIKNLRKYELLRK